MADAFPRRPTPCAANLHSFIEVARRPRPTALYPACSCVRAQGVGDLTLNLSGAPACAAVDRP